MVTSSWQLMLYMNPRAAMHVATLYEALSLDPEV
jgi:hypothetical protein